MWRSRAWGAGWLAVGVLVAASCSSGPESAESTFVVAVEIPTTSPVDSSASVPSTNAAPATVASTTVPETTDEGPLLPDPIDDAAALTDPDAPPPAVDLRAGTWAELVGVWSDIDAYWTWLNAHPTDDPEVLGVIFDPAGPEFAEQQEEMRTLIGSDWRIVAPSTIGQVVGFGCCPDPDAELATGRMRLLIETRSADGEAVVLSEANQVEQTFAGWDRRSFQVELVRSGRGDWQVWLLE